MSLIVISGVSGFIGSHLEKHLVSQGHEVVGLSRLPPSNQQKWIDATQGSDEVIEQIVNLKPTCIFHLAAHNSTSRSGSDITQILEAGLWLGALMLEASNQINARFVSSGTYWENIGGKDFRPGNLYAASKKSLRDLVEFYSYFESLQFTELVLYDTYGSKDSRSKLIPYLLSCSLSRSQAKLTHPEKLINITHIDDVTEAFVKSIDSSVEAGRYALYSPNFLKLKQVVELVQEITAREIAVEWSMEESLLDMFEPWHVAPKLPDWDPSVTLFDGLSEAWNATKI
jgi:nucleoside-diphosphate-sugar epimerase